PEVNVVQPKPVLPPSGRGVGVRRLMDGQPTLDLVVSDSTAGEEPQVELDEVGIAVDEVESLEFAPRLRLRPLAPIDRGTDQDQLPLAQLAHSGEPFGGRQPPDRRLLRAMLAPAPLVQALHVHQLPLMQALRFESDGTDPDRGG